MRFAGVIADNIGKGSALSEKLQTESDLLWNSRKKKAEERGRIAETKLTIPMLLMLLVLVMITIAPAALEM
jgi:tight adherence protein C